MRPGSAWVRAVLALVCLGGVIGVAGAQGQYPSRPIRMLVGFSPGGSTDILARIVGQKLGERFQQQVVIENRPGANGTIATELTAKAPPDGYTLLMAAAGHTVNASLNPRLPYDPVRDFSAVNLVALVPNILVVHPSMNIRTWCALILASVAALPVDRTVAQEFPSRPVRLVVPFPPGGAVDILGRTLAPPLSRALGQNVIVDNRPGGNTVIGAEVVVRALADGHTTMLVANVAEVAPHVASGKLRALAVTSLARSGVLKDVPTVAESGFPGFDSTNWFGAVARAATPKNAIDRLSAEIARALNLKVD